MLLIALAALMLQPWPSLTPVQIERCGHAFLVLHTLSLVSSLVAHYVYLADDAHHYALNLSIILVVIVLLRQSWRAVFLVYDYAALLSVCIVLLQVFEAGFMWLGSDGEWTSSLLLLPCIAWDGYVCRASASCTLHEVAHDVESQTALARPVESKRPGSLSLKAPQLAPKIPRITGALKKTVIKI